MPTNRSIPDKDTEFDNYQSNLVNLCTANQVAWGISLPQLNALTPLQTGWVATWNACKNKNSATLVQRAAKNAAKASYVAKLRIFIQAQIQYNTVMTDAQKLQCGVTPHSTAHTPVPTPESRPEIDAQAGVGNTILLRYRQEMGLDGTSRRAKPDGVDFCKIVYMVATTPPAGPEACANSLYSSRSPEKMDFTTGQSGKKLFGFGCWVNSRHEEGPFSDMFQCTIP